MEEIADVTLATEDDEDFQIDNVRERGRFSNSVRRLNFDDSFTQSNIKLKSYSANSDIDDIDRIDPATFS